MKKSIKIQKKMFINFKLNSIFTVLNNSNVHAGPFNYKYKIIFLILISEVILSVTTTYSKIIFVLQVQILKKK